MKEDKSEIFITPKGGVSIENICKNIVECLSKKKSKQLRKKK